MNTKSEIKPQIIERLGVNLYSYNYNIQEVEDYNIQEVEERYEFTRYLFDHFPTINEVINAIISSIYPDGEELAIQRKGIIDPQNNEFVSYYQNVERIKAIIKEEFNNGSDSLAE